MQMQQYLQLSVSVIVSLLFIYLLIIRSKKKRHDTVCNPPKPTGSWPFLGHLPLMGQHPHITLGKLADKYGPIITLNLGVKRALVVSSGEMAKECLGTNDKVFANRPHTLFVEHMAYNSAMFGFSPLGEYWRMIRKITTVELLSKTRVEMQRNVRTSVIKSSIKILLANGCEPIDMKQWFHDTTMDIIVRLISGKSFKERYQGEKYNRYGKALGEFFDLAGAFVPANVLPYLKWFDVGGYQHKIKTVAKEIDYVAQMWLEEHKMNRGFEKNQESLDLMDVLLDIFTKGKENMSSYEPETIVKANCMFIILAATDTTAASLTWALSLLLNNKASIKKIQDELDTIVGKERLVEESDLKNLVYLEAVIKETLRLYPPGPLSVPRESIIDCTINGYHIPTGTQLLVNLYKLHRDPKVWENPLEFQPERFLTTFKEYDFRGVNFEYIPFGSGRRMCPGISLALQIMRVTLANLFHVFDISIALGEKVDMSEGVGLTNPKATPLEVILTPRFPCDFYDKFTKNY